MLVDVRCENPECQGREESHDSRCICKGTGWIHKSAASARLDEVGTIPCPEEPVDANVCEWEANYHPATLTDPGYFDNTIFCPECEQEGVVA